jgi:hypothetical protein
VAARGRRWLCQTLLALLAAAVLVSFSGSALLADAQSDRRAIWDQVDVMVELRQDGRLHVTESDRVVFFGGPFRHGYREIPMSRIESIPVVQMSGGSGETLQPYRYVQPSAYSELVPNTYSFQRVGPNVRIDWTFPPATATNRTFQITYDAYGALRVYDDADPPYQQIAWSGVDRALTATASVNRAKLTFVLPRPVDLDATLVSGPGGEQPRDHTSDGKTWVWTANDLGTGDSLQAGLQFPPLAQASKPSWQDASDRGDRLFWEQQARQPMLNLLFLGLGLLVVVGGGLGVIIAWWSRGRDPEVGPVAEYVATPPSDLPPAVVGALVDEVVDQRDIVATLIDLARRGVLQIDSPGTRGFARDNDFTMTIVQREPDLSPCERALLVALFGGVWEPQRPVALSAMKATFDDVGLRLRSILYDELVERGFFRTSPSRTRHLWKKAAVTLGISGLVTTIGISGIVPAAWILGVALVALALLALSVARSMPQKTPAGAEAAAQWQAFRRYLEAIDRFEDLEHAQELFERYLPYAVAFGLEKSWVASFSRVSTPAPRWFGMEDWPMILPSGSAPLPGAGSTGTPAGTLPSLQTVSTQTGNSLQATSNSLFALFNTAGQTFSNNGWVNVGGGGWSSGASGGGRSVARGSSGFSGGFGLGLRLALAVARGASGGGGGGFS